MFREGLKSHGKEEWKGAKKREEIQSKLLNKRGFLQAYVKEKKKKMRKCMLWYLLGKRAARYFNLINYRKTSNIKEMLLPAGYTSAPSKYEKYGGEQGMPVVQVNSIEVGA